MTRARWGGALAAGILVASACAQDDFVGPVDPITELPRQLTAADALVDGLDSTRIEVRMPRFRLEYETLLNEPLQDLGMKRAFCDLQADFTRLTSVPSVYIEFVKQNTFVEVNEEGTEAAAVTTIGVAVTSLPPSFIVDRPFLFAIRERLSGAILFSGTIGDPTREDSDMVEMPAGPQCS